MNKKLIELSDKEIIDSVLSGKVNDFEFLIKKYESYVFKIVLKNVPSHKAEEIAHDVFIRVYKSLPTYKSKTSFQSWLATITVRTCYDFWRAHYKKEEIPLSSMNEEQEKWVENTLSLQSKNSFDREENRAETREILASLLSKIDPEDRLLLTMVYLEGLSIKEAAESLNWSESKVKVRAHRSRLELRKILHNMLQIKEKI